MRANATAGVPDYFALLGLDPAFAIDTQALDSAYHEVQRRVHPDKFAGSAGPEQRQAAQWAALANEAYRTLKQPVQRARYLVQLRGVDFGDCALPEGFLFTQLNLREGVQKAKTARDTGALTDLQNSLQKETTELHARLANQLDDEQNYQRAAQTVLILQFFDKLLAELDDAVLEAEA
jgi:molecular chaperone HscB